VRPCIACNQACVGGRFNDGLVGCTVNPDAGAERATRAGRVGRPRRVVVIGGGVAGMEAARAAALRGHRVTLHEAAGRLGGLAELAARAPGRGAVAGIIQHLRVEMARTGVAVALSSPVGAGDIPDMNADLVVLATGSSAEGRLTQRRRPGLEVPGADLPHVWSAKRALTESAGAETVVAFDDTGDMAAVGVVERLLAQGSTVRWLSSYDDPAPLVTGTMQARSVVAQDEDVTLAVVPRRADAPGCCRTRWNTPTSASDPDTVSRWSAGSGLGDWLPCVSANPAVRCCRFSTIGACPRCSSGTPGDTRNLDGAIRAGRAAGRQVCANLSSHNRS
jgi:hypothetical protein